MAKVIAVANQKGGCSKTSVVANLGIGLAMEGILHHEEGVDLVPANIELSGLEVSLSNVMSREMILKEYVEQIRDQYDYILIDCMPSLGVMIINALVAADSVLIEDAICSVFKSI